MKACCACCLRGGGGSMSAAMRVLVAPTSVPSGTELRRQRDSPTHRLLLRTHSVVREHVPMYMYICICI